MEKKEGSTHRQRRRRAPLADVVGGLNKFVGLFDGTPTKTSVLERAFCAIYEPEEIAVVTYSSRSHKVEQVKKHKEVFQRYSEWNKGLMKAQLKEVQPLAPSLLEFTLLITPTKKSAGSKQELETTSLVCTATLRGGKIVSCVEKKVLNGKARLPVDGSITIQDLNNSSTHSSLEMSGGYGSTSTLSTMVSTGSSSSDLFKGTGLEDVEQRGGAIFMNNSKDQANRTLITVVTEHESSSSSSSDDQPEQRQSDLELIDLHKSDASTKPKPPRFLLQDPAAAEGHQEIAFCHQAGSEVYFIDGRLPLHPNDKPVAAEPETKETSFFPRYKVDLSDEGSNVEVWNGTTYKTFMEACKNEGAKQDARLTQATLESLGSGSTHSSGATECVAHLSTKGNTNLMRARIKIPAGGDPSLMICLTAIEDYQRSQRRLKPHLAKKEGKFTTLHVREAKK